MVATEGQFANCGLNLDMMTKVPPGKFGCVVKIRKENISDWGRESAMTRAIDGTPIPLDYIIQPQNFR